MKRTASFLLALLMLCLPVCASAAEGQPVYPQDLNEGSYPITVNSNSSMFRIVDCQLEVSGETMIATMTVSGNGYEKLFMGTAKEAPAAPESQYAYYQEDNEGKYTYTVRVAALDVDTDCAAWSIKNGKWYDRTLVFRSDSLPGSALKKNGSPVLTVVAAVVLLAAAGAGVFLAMRRKKGKADGHGEA